MIGLRKPVHEPYLKLKHISFWIYACCFVFIIYYLNIQCNAQSQNVKSSKILMLHSYNYGYSWTDKINQGVIEQLKINTNIDYFIDYLDLKRNISEDYKKKLLNILIEKYKGKKYDVLIISDDPGFELIVKHRDLLFPKTPIVFCGLNNFDPKRAKTLGNMSGVIEEFSIKDTLNLIKKLHPNRKKIIWIGDDFTLSEQMFIKLFKDAIKDFQSDFKYEYWINVTEPDLNLKLKHVDDDVVFITAFVMKTESGQFLTIEQGSRYLSNLTDCPIYTLWDMQVGYGAIGGKVTNGETQGRLAAEIANKIVKNHPLSSLPIIESSHANIYMFDYLQLDRFGIKESQLPLNSLMINKPYSFYQVYKIQIWILVFLFAFLCFSIVFLNANIAARKLAIKQITSQKDFLRAMLVNLPVDFWAQDDNGIVITQSELSKKIWGDCLGSNFDQAIKESQYLEERNGSIAKALSGETVYKEISIKIRGEDFYFYNITAPIVSKSGITGVMGINQDITVSKLAELELIQKNIEVEIINQELYENNLASNLLNKNLRKSQAELLISYRTLRDSEKRFKNLIDNMSEGYVTINPQGQFIFANPAAEGIFGLNSNELINCNINQLLSESDAKALLDAASNNQIQKTEYLELDIRTVQGVLKTLLVSVVPSFDENHASTGANIMFIDITLRKAAEKAAFDNEVKLQSLISQIRAQIWATDTDLNVTYYLGSSFRTSIQNYNTFVGRSILDLIPRTDFTPELESAHRKAFQGFSIERTIDIGNQTFNFYLEPNRDSKGKIIGVIGIAFDTTELVKTRKQLAEVDNQLKEAEKISKLGSWILDVKDNKLIGSEMLFKIANIIDSTSLDYDEVLEHFHSDDQAVLNSIYQRLITKEIMEAEDEFRLVTSNQIYIDVFVKAKAIYNDKGEVIKLIGSLQDITERKKMEEERLKMRNLETLSTLASGIAHDFNNYLTVIGSHADELLQDLGVMKVDDVHESLKTIKRYVKTSTGLTQQLLTFARGSKPVKKLTNLSSLVFTAAQFASHGSNLKIEFDITREFWINADDHQIGGQVINNLVLNSKQARATELIISMYSSVNPVTQVEYVNVVFSDNGSGINKEYLKKIFDPYFTTKRDGSGLGLAICRSILSNHDGDIIVQSTSRKGTAFLFNIPLIKETEISIDPVKEPTLKLPKIKILIMDDEETVRYVLARMILKLGHDVTITSNEIEAVEAYSRAYQEDQPFDLSILDLTLVGRNASGEDVLNDIRKINPSAFVVVSSGYAYQMDASPEVSFNAALNKPYYIDDLSNVIKTYQDKKK